LNLALLAVQAVPQVRLTTDVLKNLEYFTGGERGAHSFQLTEGNYQGYDDSWAAALESEWIDRGDLDGDSTTDAATIFFTNGGGSGVFAYLAAVTTHTGQPRNTASVLLGDRVKILSLSVDRGLISVAMVTQDTSDAFVSPTKPVERHYCIEHGNLRMIAEQQLGLAAGDIKFALAQFGDIAPAVFVEQIANHHDEPPFMNGYPDHILFNLSQQMSDGAANPSVPQLRVIPVESFRALYRAGERAAFDRQITTLQGVIRKGKLEYSDTLDILPTVEAAPLFFANSTVLSFHGGHAVRYVTQYAQEQSVIANGDIFVSVQGLTDDGKYYLAAYLPVTTRVLPSSFDDLPKATQQTIYGDDADSYRSYVEKMVGVLNLLKPTDFEPDLSKLDRLIESIEIGK
jgi:hypothetical protein